MSESNGHAPPVKLSDLMATATIVNLSITLEYGKVITLPIGVLSWHEYNACGAEVVDPVVPKTKLVGGQKVENPNDPDYLMARDMAREERNMRRALRGFLKGGNHVDGGDFDEQLENFKQIEAGIGVAIAGFLHNAANRGRGRVVEMADSFRPVHGDGADDLRALGNPLADGMAVAE